MAPQLSRHRILAGHNNEPHRTLLTSMRSTSGVPSSCQSNMAACRIPGTWSFVSSENRHLGLRECCKRTQREIPDFADYSGEMPKTFVNVEEVVKNWAWRLYDRTATRKQRRLREKEKRKSSTYINLTVDWSDVKFRDHTTWMRLTYDNFVDGPIPESAIQTNDASAVPSPVARPTPPTASGSSDVCVLFQTKFTNNTKDPQEYTMRTEKTTRSTCSTSVETGFTRGIDLGVTLKTPGEVLEASAGYHRELSLTNSEGETFEEELTWGVESVIKVKPEHVAEAQLVVKERKQSGDFIITTKISGTVYVTFTNVRDNNSFLKATGGDVASIMEQYLETERRKGEPLEFVTIQDDTVTMVTKGSCRFRYGIRQEVKVDQCALK
ncbi:hypothetical protein LSH36_281g10028 [Paralvinella palmiformis]|uniref:Uncharacterized protein n=1 Tax=Paralvinella palmiformis TaxID=53620 RepID=A0AAD9JK46_9ANNE|nr:hypothetical protein LSH36_281g10028 [Paralvinella palmiformis]